MADFLKENKLTKWFLEGYDGWGHSRFPGGGKTNYADIFRKTHDYLNTHVHPSVETRAAVSDGDSFLTDHGPSHIEMVMRRSQHLLPKSQWTSDGSDTVSGGLDPYEVFLLLMAIHFHDVGNMYGREEHEKRIGKVMKDVPVLGELDRFELGVIAAIATCHGGKIQGDKDTISRLGAVLNNGDVRYRPRLIAAILRLADELAEDSSRASQFGLASPDMLPEGCFIYHRYASALASVHIDQPNQEISLTFKISKEEGMETFLFDGKPVFLLDYIYQRTLKAYQEMTYCSRFMRDLACRLERINVVIDAFCEPHDFSPVKSISYRLGEIGYPNNDYETLATLAPELKTEPDGNQLANVFSDKCNTCEPVKP